MENQPRRRRKPALSCVECRRRKIKCNRDDPCSHCTSTKLPCTYRAYDSRPARTGPSARTAAAPNVPIAAKTALFDGRNGSARQSPVTNHPSSYTPVDRTKEAGLVLTQVGRSKEADLVGLEDRIDILEEATGATDAESREQKPNAFSVDPNLALKVSLKKSRVSGWSDRMGNDLFACIFSCYREAYGADGGFSSDTETKAVVGEIGSLLRKSKQIARTLKASRPSRTLVDPGIDLHDVPPQYQADAMAKLYFNSFESAHRILHVPSFWRQYHRFWAGDEVTTDERLTILLVIAIGSTLSEDYQVDSLLDRQVRRWVYAAQTWLAGPLEKTQLNIAGLQVYCLTLLARHVLCIGGDLVWISAGALLHQAMQMGLHRDPIHLPSMSPLQAELRRRLWATILDLTVQSSLDSALPPRISINDYDVKPPSNVNDSELDESNTPVQPQPDDTFTQTSVQRLLLLSIPVRLRILQMLNGLQGTIAYPEVLELSKQITGVCQTCIIFMKRNGSPRFQSNMLDYLQRRILLPLHCLFANEARTQPIFYFSVKVSLDTAAAIVSFTSDEKFARLMAVAGGMFREGIRYASVTIAMEVLAQAQSRNMGGGMDNTTGATPFHKLTQDIKDQAIERIQKGETNIKNPMFLSMVMIQAEGGEDGRPLRLRMAEAARDSLQYCYDLLKARKAAKPPMDNMDVAETSASSFGDVDGFDFDFDLDFFMPDMSL